MMTSLKLRWFHQKSGESGDASLRLPTAKEQWLITVCSFWFLGGLLVDGWAHNHIVNEIESFFTPWHAAFYSGYLATAFAFLGITFLRTRRYGRTFLESIPLGYGAALVGAATFVLGGFGDMAWHEVFGIEANVEALVSPTHLILAFSMFLMATANVRAWFHTVPPIGKPALLDQLPMLFSISGAFSILSFMMQFSHFAFMRAGGVGPEDAQVADLVQNVNITGFLLHTGIFMGCILLIARRARLVPGAITFIFTLHVLEMAVMLDAQILLPAAILAGIVGDVMLARAFPFDQHRTQLRAFSFIFPATFFLGYFITLEYMRGIWWSVHLWSGSIVLAGFTGLLVSFLVLPVKEEE